jgi:hypothetical protein
MKPYLHAMLAAAIAVGCSGIAAADAPRIVAEGDVAEVLDRAGYTDVTIVEFDGTLWLAEATAADGGRVQVQVDPADGRVLLLDRSAADLVVLTPARAPLTAADVRALLEDAGYRRVHDIDFDNARGVWKAEARDADGDDWEIHVDATTGGIVHIEDD